MRKEIKILFGFMAAGYAAMGMSIAFPYTRTLPPANPQSGNTELKNIYTDNRYKKGAVEDTPLNRCVAGVVKTLPGSRPPLSLELPDGNVMNVFRAVSGEGVNTHGTAVSVFRDDSDKLEIETVANNPRDLGDQGIVVLSADLKNLDDPGTVKRNAGSVDMSVIVSMERQANNLLDHIAHCMR